MRGIASMSSAACLNRSYSCKRRTSSARGSSSVTLDLRWSRQQQSRFDFRQNCRHHQIFGGQFQTQILHQFDVVDVLTRDLGNRDVENIEILPADQIEQQVQRSLECFENDFQRIRRNVEILRHLQHRLSTHQRQRHFLLLWHRRENARGLGSSQTCQKPVYSCQRAIHALVRRSAALVCYEHFGKSWYRLNGWDAERRSAAIRRSLVELPAFPATIFPKLPGNRFQTVLLSRSHCRSPVRRNSPGTRIQKIDSTDTWPHGVITSTESGQVLHHKNSGCSYDQPTRRSNRALREPSNRTA